jgi:hypothetical protein
VVRSRDPGPVAQGPPGLTAGAPARPGRPSLAEVAGVAVLVGGIAAFAAWWWAHWRHGMPLFIDEAGYLSFAVSHARALEDGGVGDFLRSLDRQGPYGPLAPAVTAVGLLVVDRPAAVGAATMIGALAVLVVATWLLARRFCPPPWALLAAGVVGTLPGVLSLTGVYYFAVPAAALFTLALACQVRADGGARIGWMVAAGVGYGLAALARTMVAGLVPAAAAVAVVAAAWPGPRRARRLVGTAAGSAAGAVVALAWYAGNSRQVLDYLGADQVATGSGGGGRAWDIPGMRDLRLLVSDLLVPAAVVLGAVAVVAVAAGVARRRTGPAGDSDGVEVEAAGESIASGDAPPDLGLALPAAVVVLGSVVLVAAGQAVGQWIPLLPALLVVVVAGASRAPALAVRAGVAAALCGLALFHVAEVSRLSAPLSRPREVAAGPFGRLPVTDARWLLEDQLPRRLDDGGRLPDQYEDTVAIVDGVVGTSAAVAEAAGEPPVLVVVGGADPLVNLNTLRLTDLRRTAEGGTPLVVGALEVAPGLSGGELGAILADPDRGMPNLVLTVRPEERYKRSLAAYEDVTAALPGRGFNERMSWDLPDGRPLSLWFRPRSEAG